jgi:hypothetical protein
LGERVIITVEIFNFTLTIRVRFGVRVIGLRLGLRLGLGLNKFHLISPFIITLEFNVFGSQIMFWLAKQLPPIHGSSVFFNVNC